MATTRLVSEMESDLRDTVNWGRKWLVDFKAGKAQLVLFDLFIDTVAIDVKMDGGVVFLFQIGLGFLHYLYC